MKQLKGQEANSQLFTSLSLVRKTWVLSLVNSSEGRIWVGVRWNNITGGLFIN